MRYDERVRLFLLLFFSVIRDAVSLNFLIDILFAFNLQKAMHN